jgi:hypothetical protein
MRRGIAIATAGLTLAGCSSFSFDAFRSTPPTVQLQLDSVPSGADALTSLRPGCKTPLLGCRARCRCRFLGDLHAEQVPAGYRPGAGHPHPRRFLHPRLDHSRSQSGDRRTSAGGPAAEGGTEAIEAEKAKTTQGDGRSPRSIAFPRSGASTPAGRAWPLTACTAPGSGLYAERIMHRLRVAEP